MRKELTSSSVAGKNKAHNSNIKASAQLTLDGTVLDSGKRLLKDHEVYLGERGIFTRKNKLNELTGKEWTRFVKSWFIFDALASDLKEEREISAKGGLKSDDHPATFSPTMISEFVSYFTKKGQIVLDPFCGIGSTLVACKRTGRCGVGIELNPKYAKIAQLRAKQKVIVGSATEIKKLWKENRLPQIDFCISSPPYWDILQRSTGDFAKVRTQEGYDIQYSNNKLDLGNIPDYDEFLNRVCQVYESIFPLMRPGSYLCVIVKNIKKGGKVYTLAWDIAKRLSRLYVLKDEKIWCQDKIRLAPFGYPNAWTSNIVHHYCIILRKEK